MPLPFTTTNPEEEVALLDEPTEDFGYSLVVWNDDVNTFDWVIKALIDICGHQQQQAEQCALLIHFQGKYSVKQGEYTVLQPMREGIVDRGINATVEEC